MIVAPSALAHWHVSSPTPPAGGVHQQAFAGAQRMGPVQQVVRGHSLKISAAAVSSSSSSGSTTTGAASIVRTEV